MLIRTSAKTLLGASFETVDEQWPSVAAFDNACWRSLILHRRCFYTGPHATASPATPISEQTVLGTVFTILKFAKTLEFEHRTAFLTARNKNFTEDLQASSFLHQGSFHNSLLHVRFVKFVLRRTTVFSFVGTEARSDLGILHLENGTLLSSILDTAVLLLWAAQCCDMNPKWPRGEFRANEFYSSATRYVNALHPLCTSMHGVTPRRFPS